MDAAAILAAIRALPIAERLKIFEALQDDLGPEPPVPELSEAQREELRRRLADHEAHPEKAIPWEEAIAKTRARLRRQ